jgi:hypothetical protein
MATLGTGEATATPVQEWCAQSGCGHDRSSHKDGEGACGGVAGNEVEGFSFCLCQEFSEFAASKVNVRALMEARARVWSETLGHLDPPAGEHGRPYWRSSRLGYCMRAQILWRSGMAPTYEEPEERRTASEARFEYGHQMEAHVIESIELAGFLISQQIALVDPELAVAGHMDAVYGGVQRFELPSRSRFWDPQYTWAVRTLWDRAGAYTGGEAVPVTGLEVKSTNSRAVSGMRKKGARYDHRIQAGAYWLMAKRHPEQLPAPELERFELAVIGRDYVSPVIYHLNRHDVGEAEERIGLLNEAWTSGKWPLCECSQEGEMGWQRKWCSYLDPEDPSGCCGQGLLELLEASLTMPRKRGNA